VKRIHINQHLIRHNARHQTTFPVCRIEEGGVSTYCQEVRVHGPSTLVYRPDTPLPCGAKVWIETDSEVELIAPVAYASIRAQLASIKN
jgi:hypothetical protein